MIETLSDDDDNIAFWGARVLSELYPENALDPLLKKLGDADPNTRYSVCMILGSLKSVRASEALEKIALNDSDPDVRWAAVDALESCGRQETYQALKEVEANDRGVTIEGRKLATKATAILKRLEDRFSV